VVGAAFSAVRSASSVASQPAVHASRSTLHVAPYAWRHGFDSYLRRRRRAAAPSCQAYSARFRAAAVGKSSLGRVLPVRSVGILSAACRAMRS
jgi:hypothetical protein